MNSKEFGIYFQELRIKAGYESQSALALASGLESSTIHRIESGLTKHPKPQTLKIVAPYLKVPYEDLLKAAGIIEVGDFVYTPPSGDELSPFESFARELSNMGKDEQYETMKELFKLIVEDKPKGKGEK